MTPLLVIGLGSELRGDDAAGLLVARRLAARGLQGVDIRESTGDAVALAGALAGRERAVVVDAVPGRPGAVVELTPAELGVAGAPSSHGLGVSEALALALVLGGVPDVRVIGIGGRRFALGAQPSQEVVSAAEHVARLLEEELACA